MPIAEFELPEVDVEDDDVIFDSQIESDRSKVRTVSSLTPKGSASGVQPKGKLSLSWAGKESKLLGLDGGKYQWVGNNDVRVGEIRCINEDEKVTSTVKEPTPGATHDNMLIVGDSADALRVLLKHPDYTSKYRRKVKLVYIDPPFNTGQAFDHYDDGLEHSVWMTMMRDRLVQIRDMLAEDGSVWVHLDDAELAYCKVIMDEVFGREKHIATVAWKKRSNLPNDRPLAYNHEFILVYGNEKGFNLRPRPEGHGGYTNPDNDPKGAWGTHPMDANAKGGRHVDHLFYGITNPANGKTYFPASGRNWLYPESEFWRKFEAGEVIFGKTGLTGPVKKAYLDNVRPGLTWPTLWLSDAFDEFAVNNDAEREMKGLFKDAAVQFNTPKPEQLLERIIKIASNPGDIVVDCFAGSGTTAAVAHKLGRQWVTVELSPDTAKEFIEVRLKKVVNGEDDGGITYTNSYHLPAAEDFPEDGDLDEFKNAYKVLSGLVKSGVLDPKDPAVLKMKALSKSVKVSASKTWSGGGSFGIYRISPSIYSVDSGGHTFISEDVTPEEFREAMRVHCGFKKDPLLSAPFAGRQGKIVLATVNGMVGEREVNKIASLAVPGSQIRIVARAYTTGAEERIEALHPGSYLEKTPDDFFKNYTGVN